MPTAAAQRLLRDRQILMVALTNQTSRAAGLHRGTAAPTGESGGRVDRGCCRPVHRRRQRLICAGDQRLTSYPATTSHRATPRRTPTRHTISTEDHDLRQQY